MLFRINYKSQGQKKPKTLGHQTGTYNQHTVWCAPSRQYPPSKATRTTKQKDHMIHILRVIIKITETPSQDPPPGLHLPGNGGTSWLKASCCCRREHHAEQMQVPIAKIRRHMGLQHFINTSIYWTKIKTIRFVKGDFYLSYLILYVIIGYNGKFSNQH